MAPMGTRRVIQQGECLSAIATKYGFATYRALYDHPENASLRWLRPNPNVIFPGDVVFIPDKEPKTRSCATTRQHNFVLHRTTVRLRLVLEDDKGVVLADRPYVLTVDGAEHRGRTSPDGMLDVQISARATRGELWIWPGGTEGPTGGEVFALALGALDPVEEVTGVQARLNNIGYHCGNIDGLIGPATRRALRDFQAHQGLDPSGAVDEPTRRRLREVHDE
jgi:hypothetical protein